jgi:hypothetical protein
MLFEFGTRKLARVSEAQKSIIEKHVLRVESGTLLGSI